MTLNAQFCQLGQYVVPVDSILSIDLNHARDAGGTNVRVWLRAQGSNLFPAMQNTGADQTPNYYDFLGAHAQNIRRWAAAQSKQGGLTVILSAIEEAAAATQTPAPRSARRPARKKAPTEKAAA